MALLPGLICSMLSNHKSMLKTISSPRTQWLLLRCVIILLNLSLVVSQTETAVSTTTVGNLTTTAPENGSLSCDQCNSGEVFHSILLRPFRTDCVSGHFYAVLRAGTRCECDFVCARESRQACRVPTPTVKGNLTLCDTTLNLKCNEQTSLCEGPLLVSVSHVRHESFYVNWQSESSPTSQVGSHLRVAISKYTSPVVNQTNFLPVKTYITKSESGKLSSKVESLQENTTYIVKVTDNGKEELLIVTTSENPLVEALPKVLVTVRNASSISIAFDDFKPANYNHGYGIKYRPIVKNSSLTSSSWSVLTSTNSTPFYVLNGLKPSTQYQIQVFTWDTSGEQIRSHSETVSVSTLDGCLHQNGTFAVGDKVVDDCEQTCLCALGGSLQCTERCVHPLVSTSYAKTNQLQCSVQAGDECCVRCKATTATSSNSKKFIDKPGDCSEVLNESSKNVTCGKGGKSNECTHDYHCTGVKKCCAGPCGHLSCQHPTNSSVSLAKCPFKCGPNAACLFNEEESTHKCVCLDGFQGEEPIRGCVPKPSRLHQCTFQARLFAIGQTFEHGCETCLCSEALEVECSPKCAQLNQSSLSPHCKLVPDPSDPVCCQKQHCESPVTAHNESSLLREGCKHLGQIYKVNETFHIECELKCLCKTNGEIECAPRCFADPGYDESFCYLVEDPDDPECCKISICDHNSTTVRSDLIIEMAEAVNSTSLKLRLVANISLFETQNSTIFYSKVMPNETEQEISRRNWNSTNIFRESLVVISNKSAEVSLSELKPETDYLLYVKADNSSSNTVFVRTYPAGINNTFKGCFHGSEIIQVGQIFDEGDCEYRCVCREGGFRECEERCPNYVDLIGYENCQWEPSSEDPCCTVPLCQNQTSTLQCSSSDGRQFNLGDTWSVGSGCLQKTCHCVVEGNGTAHVKCKGGCPIIPQEVIEPNAVCPSPKVIQPKDVCVCPYVVCDNNINPLDLPEKKQQQGTKDFCLFKGDKIAIGKEFYDNCRATCMCEAGAVLNCKPIQCSHNFGPHTTKCLEWDIDPHFMPVAPNCCPEPKCKNDGSCSYAGIRFGNYKNIPQELLPCGKRCHCNNGQIRCENLCPEVADEPPPGLPCPQSQAFRGHLPGDKCCIHWQCRDIFQDRIKGSCVYKEKRFKLGEQWDENDTGMKRRCNCKMTNGIMHVACNPGNCQPITERYLYPTAECITPTVVVPKDPIMCPYVVCNNSRPEGGELENVDIVAINATSARIRFTIPSLYVGLLGHAEVHYTTDMNIARNQWNIQKFARPKRMFDIPNIEYHLGNLKPDTTYFLQIEVLIEALKSGPSSEIFKLYQPPMPVTSSTTTTTTTSTLPPIIMLDMHLSAKAIDSSSVKVTWRAFTTQERKFIDAIQIRYKKADLDSEEWSYSAVLHRNTREYVLDKLESGLTYAVDLIFTSLEGINTNIVSTKPVVVDLPAPPKDEFQFAAHIYPDDVAINDGQIDIEVRNLPRPVSKFVNVAKLCYQNMQSSQLMFDYINVDESAKFSFSNLLSNTRYKVWIDFYLSNGQIVSSNSIDIITKYNKDRALEENDTGALTGHLTESKYVLTFLVLSVFVFVTGAGFMVVTCIFMRKHSKAAISRVCISEAAYDNPTYKTFETTEKCMDDSLSKSSTMPAK